MGLPRWEVNDSILLAGDPLAAPGPPLFPWGSACHYVRFKKTDHPAERWPSGLRRTLGKRVYFNEYRGFESHSLRHDLFQMVQRKTGNRAQSARRSTQRLSSIRRFAFAENADLSDTVYRSGCVYPTRLIRFWPIAPHAHKQHKSPQPHSHSDGNTRFGLRCVCMGPAVQDVPLRPNGRPFHFYSPRKTTLPKGEACFLSSRID